MSGILVRYGATMLKTIGRPPLAEERITGEVCGVWERGRFSKRKNALLNIPPGRWHGDETPLWRYTWSIRSSAFLIVTLKDASSALFFPLQVFFQ
jgi:hypothetical protein